MKLGEFKNITAFELRDDEDQPLRNLTLDRAQTYKGLDKPIGLALSTSGVIPLFEGKETWEDMANDKGSALRHRRYSRILPAHVIKDELNKWATEYETAQGHPPSKVEERTQRLRIETDLTPKAFIKHKDTFILRSYQTLIITTATESLSDTVRADFWELPTEEVRFLPFFETGRLRAKFDTWARGEGLDGFEVDPEGSFQLSRERDGAQVRGKGTDVSDKRFTELLEQGYRVTRLPLIQIETEASFQIDTSGRIRGLHFPQFSSVLEDQLGDDDSRATEDLATVSIMRSMILTLLLDLRDEIANDAEDLV